MFLTDHLLPRVEQLLVDTSLPACDVAVLCKGSSAILVRSVLTQHNIPMQTIEQHLLTRSTSKVVVDEYENVASSEYATVFAVGYGGGVAVGYFYNMLSRARTSLTVILFDDDVQRVQRKFPNCIIHHY